MLMGIEKRPNVSALFTARIEPYLIQRRDVTEELTIKMISNV
jgi:hypothetical protein